jgi:hypothetical protein
MPDTSNVHLSLVRSDIEMIFSRFKQHPFLTITRLSILSPSPPPSTPHPHNSTDSSPQSNPIQPKSNHLVVYTKHQKKPAKIRKTPHILNQTSHTAAPRPCNASHRTPRVHITTNSRLRQKKEKKKKRAFVRPQALPLLSSPTRSTKHFATHPWHDPKYRQKKVAATRHEAILLCTSPSVPSAEKDKKKRKARNSD